MNDGGLRAPVTGSLVDLPWLRDRAEAWDRLLERAAYPNPHHGRHVVEAHEAAGISPPRLFAASHRAGELLALMPLAPRSRLGWRGARAGWTSPFAPNGTPLIAGDQSDAAARGLLRALATGPGPRIVRLPLVSLDHAAIAAIRTECVRLGWPVIEGTFFARPVLDADGPPPRSRRTIERRKSKLADLGVVAHRVETEGEGLARAVEAFLAIEALGWKGRRGTAMASRPATASLARRLFGDAAPPVSVRADLLTLDDTPIAASLALVCGGTAHLLKSAYDEAHRRFGPGVMLEDAIIRSLRETGFAERLDSASVPGGILEDLFPSRERIGELVIGASPGLTSEDLDRAARAEAWIQSARARLAALYWRLRSWGR